MTDMDLTALDTSWEECVSAGIVLAQVDLHGEKCYNATNHIRNAPAQLPTAGGASQRSDRPMTTPIVVPPVDSDNLKQCSKCGELKPLDAFSADRRNTKDGKQSQCKACNRAYYEANLDRERARDREYRAQNRDALLEQQRQYRAENTDRVRENRRAWYAKNRDRVLNKRREGYSEGREECRERNRQYRAEHRDDLLEKSRQYRAKHRDEINERKRLQRLANYDHVIERERQYVKENADYIRARRREYTENNREKVNAQKRTYWARRSDAARENTTRYVDANRERIRQNARRLRAENPVPHRAHVARRKLKLKESGTFTTADIEAIRVAQGNRCYLCKKSLSDGYHIDHFIPLAKGGTNDPGNLRLACPHCNLSKGAKHPHELGILI